MVFPTENADPGFNALMDQLGIHLQRLAQGAAEVLVRVEKQRGCYGMVDKLQR